MRQRSWLVVSYAITLLFIWVSIARLENSSTQGREHGAISIAVTLENCILGPFTVLFFLPFTVLNLLPGNPGPELLMFLMRITAGLGWAFTIFHFVKVNRKNSAKYLWCVLGVMWISLPLCLGLHEIGTVIYNVGH